MVGMYSGRLCGLPFCPYSLVPVLREMIKDVRVNRCVRPSVRGASVSGSCGRKERVVGRTKKILIEAKQNGSHGLRV